MSNTILLKRSSTQGSSPTTGQLQLGELAINTYDGKLFLEKNDGSASIIEVGSVSLSGDVTGSGSSSSGAVAVTLATVNSNVGSYGDGTHVATFTVNGKGLTTAAGSVAIAFPVTTVFGQTGAISDLSGDVTTSGSSATTLATVNGSPVSDAFQKVTVNGKGLVTATAAVVASDIISSLAYTPANKAGDTFTGPVLLASDPSQALGAATKQYVDAAVANLYVHGAARAATTADLGSVTYSNGTAGVGATITNAGTQAAFTLDGVTFVAGDRVLVKNQATSQQNGIYNVTTVGDGATNWVLTRSTDADGAPPVDFATGAFIYVQEGTINNSTGWTETAIGSLANDAINIGTDAVTFTQFSGAGSYLAGTGLALTGNVFSNTGVLETVAGAGISVSGATGNVTIANTGVTSVSAGTNISVSAATGGVTISVTGTVASATTATNLAGGAANSVPYQTGAGVTAFVAAGNGVLQENGGAPTWTQTPILTGTNFSGIPNGALVNDSVTIGSTNVALGGTSTTLAGLSSVTSTSFVGNLTGNADTVTTNANLTGDVTSVGNATTLATVNSDVGTYAGITVNAKGLVTAATALTTLAGYGITDAVSSSGTIDGGSF